MIQWIAEVVVLLGIMFMSFEAGYHSGHFDGKRERRGMK